MHLQRTQTGVWVDRNTIGHTTVARLLASDAVDRVIADDANALRDSLVSALSTALQPKLTEILDEAAGAKFTFTQATKRSEP